MFVLLGILFVALVTLPFWGPWLVVMLLYIGAGLVTWLTD